MERKDDPIEKYIEFQKKEREIIEESRRKRSKNKKVESAEFNNQNIETKNDSFNYEQWERIVGRVAPVIGIPFGIALAHLMKQMFN